MASRRLTPEEATRLADLATRYGRTGIPEGDPNRAFVQGLLDEYRAGQLQLTQEELFLIEGLLLTPREIREFTKEELPALIAALLPFLAPLLTLPVVGPILQAVLGMLAGTVSRAGQRLLTFLMGISGLSVINAIFGVTPELANQLGQAIATGVRTSPEAWRRIVAQVVSDLTGGEIPPEALGGPGRGGPVFQAALGLARYIFTEFTGFIAPTTEITPETGVENAIRYLSANMSLQMTAWHLGLVHEMTSLGISRALKDLPSQISWSMGLGWLSWLVFGAPFRAAIADPLEVHYNRTYQFARLTPAQIVSLRRGRWIDDATYEDWMTDHGFNFERRSLLLEEAMANPTRAEIEQWLQLGVVDEDYAAQKLRRAGYREEDVWRYLSAFRLQRSSDELQALIRTAERLYQDGRVSLTYLQQLWDQAGLLPEEQDLRIVRLQLESATEKTLSKGEVLDAYRDGAIDEGEARARLCQMGYVDEDIDVLLRRETRRLSPAQVVDAAIRGLLSREEATQRLLQFGYSESDAAVLLSLARRELTPGQILDALHQGLIGLQEARRRLLAQGFREEDADLMLAFSQKRLSPADIQAALLRGFLTPEAAREYLIRSGYAPADADLILALRYRLLSVGEILDALLAGIIPYSEALGRLQQLGYIPDDATLLLATAVKRTK